MKINCLSCGHNVSLDEAYDNYEGQIKCFACGAILEIKSEDASLKAVTLTKAMPGSSVRETVQHTR